MKKDPKQEAWIPMVDYLYRGVRKERIHSDPFAGKRYRQFPETWVPMEDAMLRGVQKNRQATNESFIHRIKPAPSKVDVPHEAYQTIFYALQQIWAVPKANGAVFSRIKSIHAADQAEWAAGRIPSEEFQRRKEALSAMRTAYAAQSEEVTDWFLHTCFRMFETLPNAVENQ